MKTQALRLALIVNAGLAVALALTWIQQAREGRFWESDFSMFFTGGRIVLDGHGEELYDLDVQTAYQADIVPERAPGSLLIFNYPPHVGLLTALLALMARDTAFFVWTVVQLGVFSVQCSVFRKKRAQAGPSTSSGPPFLLEKGTRGSGLPDRLEVFAIFITLLAFPGLFVNFQMGQVSLLVAVALFGLVRAVEADRLWQAAGWLLVASSSHNWRYPLWWQSCSFDVGRLSDWGRCCSSR